MTAMDNATRNAGEAINKLTLNYNRTRQANIRRDEALGRELLGYPNAFLFELNEVLAHHGRRFSQEDAFMSINHASFVDNFDASHDGNRLEPAGRATDYFDSRVDEAFSAIWRSGGSWSANTGRCGRSTPSSSSWSTWTIRCGAA